MAEVKDGLVSSFFSLEITGKLIGAFPPGAIQGQVQHPKTWLCRLVFDDERMHAHHRHVQTGTPARVGFLDTTRQRRFASH